MEINEDIKKVFRCEECNLIPLINYYFEIEDDECQQKINIKCRNNHSFKDIKLEEFLDSYIKEEDKNKDSICQEHNKKIEKICKKCELNLCSECKHDCDEVMSLKDFSLSEKEKDNIKDNFNKFNPFFEELKNKINNGSKDDYLIFSDNCKKLLSFGTIIFSTYLKYEKENNLCYEIIRNCKMCLKFKYKKLSLENDSTNVLRSNPIPKEIELFLKFSHFGSYEPRKIELYLKPKNYIIMPTNDVDESKFKLLTDYEIDLKTLKDSYFSSYAELLDNKFAMVENENINIYDNDSLDILFTIIIRVEKDDEDDDCIYKISSLFCLQNGNLMATTYDRKIYIFNINKDSYKQEIEFEIDDPIYCAIELSNKKILVFTSNKIFLIYSFNKKSIKYELETKFKIDSFEENVYYAKIIDFKDLEKVMIVTNAEMGYFNYKKGIFEKKCACIDSWYQFDVSFFRKNLIIESNMGIFIKDRKTLDKISFLELDNSYQYDADRAFELNDGSFLCGMSNKYNIVLRQYCFSNNNIIELSKLSFSNYKENFIFIYQLKNGNIIGSLSTGEYFMLK